MWLKCETCGGVYQPVQAGGGLYFHTCPPLERVIVEQPDGSRAIVAPDPDDKRPIVGTTTIPRPGVRDERPIGVDPATGQVLIASPGRGVRVVPAPIVEEG